MDPKQNPSPGTKPISSAAQGPVQAGAGSVAERRPDQPRVVVRHPASHSPSHSVVQAAASPARRVDDTFRRWIAENLMVGASPQSVLETMKAGGFSPQEAAHEINLALQSPYYQASERLTNRLRKRDWVLANYRKLNRLHPRSSEVERRNRISRDEFLIEFYSANRPVIITGMMDDWPAMSKWCLDYFSDRFGGREVEVQTGRNSSPDYEIQSEKFVGRVRFGDFVERVRTAGETNDFYLTANNDSHNRRALSELWEDIVQIPEYLKEDQPGGFFWMGPSGTLTPFHHDLTNNFMAQVIGRKRVKIAPSWDLPLMSNLHHCFSQADGRDLPATPNPAPSQPQILDCILHPGEVLFLPIGCLHFVQGLDITVTVSFTNFVFDNDFYSYYTNYGPV
ncbi:MAG: cupin-like domain-containing protein [Isosphaeraceae bacterium]